MPSDVLERYASELRCARGGLVTHVGADVLVAFAAEVERLCKENERLRARLQEPDQRRLSELRKHSLEYQSAYRVLRDAFRVATGEAAQGNLGALVAWVVARVVELEGDAALGALVRRMLCGAMLTRYASGRWSARRDVVGWPHTGDTPEEALRAALGEEGVP